MAITDQMIARELEQVTKLLTDEVKDPITTVNENEFKRGVLSLLLNIGEHFDIVKWIELVGHPHVRLHVLDHKGDVKYDIPPILQPQKTAEKTEFNMSDLSGEFQAMRADNPQYASRHLLRTLQHFTDKDYDAHENASEMAAVLNRIFADNNQPIPFPAVPVAAGAVPAVAPVAPTIEIDGYDDL